MSRPNPLSTAIFRGEGLCLHVIQHGSGCAGLLTYEDKTGDEQQGQKLSGRVAPHRRKQHRHLRRLTGSSGSGTAAQVHGFGGRETFHATCHYRSESAYRTPSMRFQHAAVAAPCPFTQRFSQWHEHTLRVILRNSAWTKRDTTPLEIIVNIVTRWQEAEGRRIALLDQSMQLPTLILSDEDARGMRLKGGDVSGAETTALARCGCTPAPIKPPRAAAIPRMRRIPDCNVARISGNSQRWQELFRKFGHSSSQFLV